MDFLRQYLDRVLFGNSPEEGLAAAALFVGIVGSLLVVRRLVVKRLEEFAKHTATDVDDLLVELLAKTRFFFILAVALVSASSALSEPPISGKTKDVILFLALFVQASIWTSALVAYWVKKLAARSADGHGNIAIISALAGAARVVVIIALFLMLFDGFVTDVTPLIAGLGIGGIAIALAVQAILGDLFGAVSILVDKPFQVGDFIVVDTLKGTVEHIGMKSTRVRSLGGEQIIFSNADLLKSRVRNFKRMLERRIAFTTGVVYQTEPDKLQRIPSIIREAVERQKPIRFERCHFLKFADSWLEFETVFWVLSPDYMLYADIQQNINLEIFRKFSDEGIEFAYPTTQFRIDRGKEGDPENLPLK